MDGLEIYLLVVIGIASAFAIFAFFMVLVSLVHLVQERSAQRRPFRRYGR